MFWTLLIQTLQFIAVVFYSILESFYYLFVTKKEKDVNEQIVLITGAGSGLGRALAIELSKKGCVLLLLDVNLKSIEETASMIREIKGKCYTFVCDLSEKKNIIETLIKIKKEIGDVDILINNAGIVHGKSILETTDDQVEKTMKVNLMAHFWLIKGILPSMLSRNHGHIVSISSVAGLFGINRLSDYCASKFAVVGLDESLRQEIIAYPGIKTTCVCPYYINTGMFHGVKTKFPNLIPIVDVQYATRKILRAILTNEEILIFPRFIHVFCILKPILPMRALRACFDFFEVNKDMETFVGRERKIF